MDHSKIRIIIKMHYCYNHYSASSAAPFGVSYTLSAQFLWSHLHLILTSKHHHINCFYHKIFLKNYVFIFLRSNNFVLKGGRMPHQKKHYLMILTICFQLLLHAILSWMMINYGVFWRRNGFWILVSSFKIGEYMLLIIILKYFVQICIVLLKCNFVSEWR